MHLRVCSKKNKGRNKIQEEGEEVVSKNYPALATAVISTPTVVRLLVLNTRINDFTNCPMVFIKIIRAEKIYCILICFI